MTITPTDIDNELSKEIIVKQQHSADRKFRKILYYKPFTQGFRLVVNDVEIFYGERYSHAAARSYNLHVESDLETEVNSRYA